MAKLYGLNNAVDFAAKNLINFTSIFARSAGQPLDKTAIWYPAYVNTEDSWNVVASDDANATYKTGFERAAQYAATPAAYVGQELAVIDVVYEEDGETVKSTSVKFYGIQDDAGTLKELGAIPVGDESTIVVAADGTISLKGIEALEFERDILGEDDQPTGEKEVVKYQPLLTKDGLTWVEPSKTTVEGLATLIAELESTTDSLTTSVAENTAAISAEATAREAADKALSDAIGAASKPESAEGAGDAVEATGLYKAIEEAEARAKAYADANDADTAYDDTELAGRVKAIEDDYLKSADKYDDTELAGRVTTIETTIGDATTEGTILKGIADNKAAIEAENKRAIAAEAQALSDAKGYTDTEITGLEIAIEKKTVGEAETDHIVIKNSKGVEVASVNAAQFVKDGMLTNAVYSTETKKLTLTWNTDAGIAETEIDLNDLVNTYTGSEHVLVSTEGVISLADDVALDSDLTALDTKLSAVIDTKQTAEQVSAAIEAAGHANKTYVDEELAKKADKADYDQFVEDYTTDKATFAIKSEVETALGNKVDSTTYANDMATVAKTETVNGQFTAVGQRIDLVEETVGKAAEGENEATGLFKEIADHAAHAEATYATKTELKATDDKAVSNDAAIKNLTGRLDGIVAQGGEPNTINTIKVNGVAQTIAEDKSVDIVGTDVVSNVKLENLQDGASWTTKIDKNVNDITALGTRVGDAERTVTDHGTAISTLSTKVSALEAEVRMESESRIDALEGIVSGDGAENTGLVGKVAAHTADITNLKAKDTELETEIDANTAKLAGISGTVKDYVDSAVGGVDLSQLATKAEVEQGDTAVVTQLTTQINAKADAAEFQGKLDLKANAADVYTTTDADAKFVATADLNDKIDARVNTLIDGANNEDTITNVTNLIEFVNDNAGDIAELVTTVDNNAKAIAANTAAIEANTAAHEKNAGDIAALITTVAAQEVKESTEISVTEVEGEGATGVQLGIKEVNVNKLVQTTGDILILDGGSATVSSGTTTV